MICEKTIAYRAKGSLTAFSAHNWFFLDLIDRLAIPPTLMRLLLLRRLVHFSASLSCLRGSRQKDLTALVLSGLRNVCLHVALVKVVIFEELLHAVTAQLGLAFTHRLGIFPLLVIDVIRVEVIYVNVRNIRRLHAT